MAAEGQQPGHNGDHAHRTSEEKTDENRRVGKVALHPSAHAEAPASFRRVFPFSEANERPSTAACRSNLNFHMIAASPSSSTQKQTLAALSAPPMRTSRCDPIWGNFGP